MRPGLVAAVFAGAGALAHIASLSLLRQGGFLALISVPLAFFAAGVLAAGGLRISLPARVGFGVILAVGAFGSFLGLVATQAITGREGAGELFVGFSVFFVGSYVVGSALGWLLVRKLGSRVLVVGVLGLCAGALLAAAVATLLMDMHTLTVYTGAIPMSIPGAVGAATVTWSLDSTGRPERVPSHRSETHQ